MNMHEHCLVQNLGRDQELRYMTGCRAPWVTHKDRRPDAKAGR